MVAVIFSVVQGNYFLPPLLSFFILFYFFPPGKLASTLAEVSSLTLLVRSASNIQERLQTLYHG